MVMIGPMLKEDISSVAIIHSDAFSRQLGAFFNKISTKNQNISFERTLNLTINLFRITY
jgi:hypothetical protein